MIMAICAGTYAYMGPLSLLAAAGEVKNVKIMPKAMFWAFVTIILLYAAAILVCLGLVNYKEYSTMASPFTDRGRPVCLSEMLAGMGAECGCMDSMRDMPDRRDICSVGDCFTV